MKISVIQSDITWENKSSNLSNLALKLAKIPKTDLIVLPEMFTTGFTMIPTYLSENMPGETLTWMKQWSQRLNSAICGSLIILENDCYYNRFVFARPDGRVEFYDKSHLFSFAGEDQYFTKGSNKIVIEWMGFKILPMICYDLRFPEFSRYSEEYPFDVIINVANWPKARSVAWKTLLRARAIENQCYVIGCNRIGKDGNDLEYSGDSAIIDPLGEILIESIADSVLTAEISIEHVLNIRGKFPFLRDRDII